jgi:hypothetical protein
MMVARALPLEDVTATATDLPLDVAAGLELLARSRPLWPIGMEDWVLAVGRARAFAERWNSLACAAGWTSLQLYGLHRRAP